MDELKDVAPVAETVTKQATLYPGFKKRAFITSIAFNENENILAATGSDGRIFFYKSKSD